MLVYCTGIRAHTALPDRLKPGGDVGSDGAVRAATGEVVRGKNRITPLGGAIGTAWTRASWRGRGADGTLLCGLSSAWALLSCLPRGVVGASTCGSKMDLYATRGRCWRTPPTLTKKAKVREMVHAARRWSSEYPVAASFIAARTLPIDALLRA